MSSKPQEGGEDKEDSVSAVDMEVRLRSFCVAPSSPAASSPSALPLTRASVVTDACPLPILPCPRTTLCYPQMKSAVVSLLPIVVGCAPGFTAFPVSAAVASGLADLFASEPANALSLPTWTIHVASVVEWVVAMALVWKYGDTPGNAAWKGLSWGMVPLLGGAMCACTWHFFYNAESLEILVALQAGLTVLGNFTMWLAAFRIYRSSQINEKL